MSWLAYKSIDGWEVESHDSVPRRTTIEVRESIVEEARACNNDFPSALRILVDSGPTSNYIDAWECAAQGLKIEAED